MRNRLLFAFVFAIMLSTCSKNEEEVVEPIRDIQEQAIADDVLQNCLNPIITIIKILKIKPIKVKLPLFD